jgi:xanthine dehydrogenase iron-sulfur cluster and FAD-binding subunit A
MKATSLCKEPGTSWRFILERIPVTKHHVDISQVLVKFLKQTKQVRGDCRYCFNGGLCVYILHEC